jgi:hypothetical protein
MGHRGWRSPWVQDWAKQPERIINLTQAILHSLRNWATAEIQRPATGEVHYSPYVASS